MARAKLSVEAAIKRQVPRGSKLLIAVSGGVDSMTLLAACIKLRRLMGICCAVAHVDHGFRPTSAADAEMVAARAAELGVSYYGCRLGVRPKGANLESWARSERYAFLESVRADGNLDWILTAHHADDAAETLLLQLLRNRPLSGIAGCDAKRHLIRPLLGVRRQAIVEYATGRNLKWVEDESNLDVKFLRNRVRHELVPYLEENFDTGIVGALTTAADRQALDTQYLMTAAVQLSQSFSKISFGSKAWLSAIVDLVEREPLALSWRVVEQLFEPRLGIRLGYRLSSAVVLYLRGQAEAPALPGGHYLARSKGGIVVRPSPS